MPYETSVPFTAGSDGYESFRIPACIRTPNGDLLALAEGRVNSTADAGDIDIVQRRSTDGGKTWSELKVTAQYGNGTAGNPAPIVLPGEGARIVLLYVTNAATADETSIRRGQVSAADGRRVWVQHSDDDGETWSAATEITGTAKHPDWRWYALTPGHALVLRHGPHAGRLVVPGNHSTPPAAGDDGADGRYNGGHDLLSDDHGATWRIGYTDDNPDNWVNVNETTAAELPDGTVYFNTRTDSDAPVHRADARSTDGGATLTSPFAPQMTLTAPVIEGSLLQLPDGGPLLFSAPGDPVDRTTMTLRTSTDGGKTWTARPPIDTRPAAYSDLVQIDNDVVGLLYETGDTSPYTTLTFLRIPVDELRS